MKNIKNWFRENLVVLFFALLCLGAYIIAKQAPYVVVSDLVNRVMRNSIMVLALIIPILAGMGLNFGIVVGAMSAQAALILVTHWRLTGVAGILTTLVIATVISVICGWLLGRLFNRTRGQEMITGMIAGYFGQGIYLLIFLVLLGTVIPFWDPELSISTGIGVKDTLNLREGMKGALDAVCEVSLGSVLIVGVAVFALYLVYHLYKGKKSGEARKSEIVSGIIKIAALIILAAALFLIPGTAAVIRKCDVPVVTLIFILLVSALCQYVTTTKLGQDFRSVGTDIRIAEAAGINVNKIRILEIGRAHV